MSDVKRVTLTTISEVVKKGGGGGGPIGGPFGALAFDAANAMSAPFGGGSGVSGSPFGGSNSPATKDGGGSAGGGPNGGKSGSGKKHKTVRLELNLFEPTAESFPEFNFSKLVHEEQKRLKKANKKQHDDANNGFLSEPELDNDVARMARELERKYGSGTAYAGKNHHSKPSKLDYYDRGAGYDEEDSFIDNSEAYDELIPQEIETVGGGFYINSGQLEFKQLSNFERPDDIHRMPKPKKRALSTTSESSEDDEPCAGGAAKKKTDEAPRQPSQVLLAPPSSSSSSSLEKPPVSSDSAAQRQSLLTEEERANQTANSGPEATGNDDKPRVNGHVSKKQKLTDLSPPKAAVDKDKIDKSSSIAAVDGGGGAKEKTNGGTVKTKVSTTQESAVVTLVGGKKEENENDGSGGGGGGVKLIKTTTVKDMLRAKRDSLRKMEQEKKGRSSGSSRVSSSEAEEDGDGGGDDDDEDEENDEDDDDDDEEEDEDDEMGDGSEKDSNESGSEEDIGSESDSSHESTSEKDATSVKAKPAPTTVNGGTEGSTPMVVVSAEQQHNQQHDQQQQQQQQQQKEKERKRKESTLPDDLPGALRKAVESLKELAQTHAIGGKLNYFDSKVAEVLLQVDEEARMTGNSTRNAIFRHLEAQLSISRQSLQLKIKKIRIRKLEARAKVAHDQLEGTINDQMPLLIAMHANSCRKVAEQRAAQSAAAAAATAAAAAAGNSSVLASGSDAALSNGEKSGTQTTSTGGNTSVTGNTPQIRNPKKKFSWNERTRDLLWELYSVRVELYAILRPRNENEDDFVAEYLRNKLVPLWPKGWIRYEDLHKELDRRKKALAKGGAAIGMGSVGPTKKHPPVALSPLTSPPPAALDTAAWLGSTGSIPSTMNGTVKTPGTPASFGGGGGGKSGSSPGGGAAITPVSANLSPNGVASKRNASSSDHSIINIMNSPPPPPGTEKHSNASANRSQTNVLRASFDEDQLMQSPPNPATSGDGFNVKRGSVTPYDPKAAAQQQHTPDRPRWNSREDDSDSSIEIIGEYNVAGGGGVGGGGHSHNSPIAMSGAAAATAHGVIHSAKSMAQSIPAPTTMSVVTTASSTTTSSVLPVLNKEKYKNLIAGKNKTHGSSCGSGGGNSPVGSLENSPSSGVGGGGSGSGSNALAGVSKYAKHSPSSTGDRGAVPGGAAGGTTSFASPAGISSTSGGGIRISDMARMKDTSASTPTTTTTTTTAPTLDLDVQQIMKDLKEFQELQQHHSAGSGRKAQDTATIPPQQQHDRSQKPNNNGPIVVD